MSSKVYMFCSKSLFFRARLDQFGEPNVSKFGNNLPTVIGWGRTSNKRGGGPVRTASTDIQQKLKMPARDNRDCIARWRNILNADLTGELR